MATTEIAMTGYWNDLWYRIGGLEGFIISFLCIAALIGLIVLLHRTLDDEYNKQNGGSDGNN